MPGASGNWGTIDDQRAGGYVSDSEYNAAQNKADSPSLWDRFTGIFTIPTRSQAGLDGATGQSSKAMKKGELAKEVFGGAAGAGGFFDGVASVGEYIKWIVIIAAALLALFFVTTTMRAVKNG